MEGVQKILEGVQKILEVSRRRRVSSGEVSPCHISGVVADLTERRTRREAGDAAARGCLRH